MRYFRTCREIPLGRPDRRAARWIYPNIRPKSRSRCNRDHIGALTGYFFKCSAGRPNNKPAYDRFLI